MRICGAEERELRRAGECRAPARARAGPLPALPAPLPATSDVSIRVACMGGGSLLDAVDPKCVGSGHTHCQWV